MRRDRLSTRWPHTHIRMSCSSPSLATEWPHTQQLPIVPAWLQGGPYQQFIDCLLCVELGVRQIHPPLCLKTVSDIACDVLSWESDIIHPRLCFLMPNWTASASFCANFMTSFCRMFLVQGPRDVWRALGGIFIDLIELLLVVSFHKVPSPIVISQRPKVPTVIKCSPDQF